MKQARKGTCHPSLDRKAGDGSKQIPITTHSGKVRCIEFICMSVTGDKGQVFHASDILNFFQVLFVIKRSRNKASRISFAIESGRGG
jgi:hypothetical protein